MPNIFDQFDQTSAPTVGVGQFEAPIPPAPPPVQDNIFDIFDEPTTPDVALEPMGAPITLPEAAPAPGDATSTLGGRVDTPIRAKERLETVKSTWEDVIKPTPARAAVEMTKGAGGGLEFISDITGSERLNRKSKEWLEAAGQVEEQIQREHPLEEGSWAEAGAGALSSMYMQAPFMAAGALASGAKTGANIALAGMGAVTGGATYAKRREQGLGIKAASASAAFDATVEILTEKLPMDTVMSMLKPAGKLSIVKRIGSLYGQEMIGESLATFLQDANEKIMADPALSAPQRVAKLQEYIKSGEAKQNWIRTLKTTAIQTTLMGAGAGSINYAEKKYKEAKDEIAGKPDETTTTTTSQKKDEKQAARDELLDSFRLAETESEARQILASADPKDAEWILTESEEKAPQDLETKIEPVTKKVTKKSREERAAELEEVFAPKVREERKAGLEEAFAPEAKPIKKEVITRLKVEAVKEARGSKPEERKAVTDRVFERKIKEYKAKPKVEGEKRKIEENELVNGITRKAAGEMMANGDIKILDHISEGIKTYGVTLMQDAIRNQEIAEVASYPKEQRAEIKEQIAKVRPAITALFKEELSKKSEIQEVRTDEVEKQAQEAATSPLNELPEPTTAQIEAGNYKKGHIRAEGFDVTIENPSGSERKGVDLEGKSWKISMVDHYGYIKGTEGVDGDQIDVFINPEKPDSGKVYVVDQVNKDGSYDEHKVVMGRESIKEATKAYNSNYEKGWNGLGDITEMTTEEFKEWTKGNTTKPVSEKIKTERRKVGTKGQQIDRRKESPFEKDVEDMSKEEMKTALLKDTLTGLDNERGFWQEFSKENSRFVARLDMDNLHDLNDVLGYSGSDQLIKEIARVAQDSGVYVAREKGDEFLSKGDSQTKLKSDMEKLTTALDYATIEIRAESGKVFTKTGIGVSYGIEESLNAAEAQQKLSKERRLQEGKRIAGRQPGASAKLPGLVEVSPEGRKSEGRRAKDQVQEKLTSEKITKKVKEETQKGTIKAQPSKPGELATPEQRPAVVKKPKFAKGKPAGKSTVTELTAAVDKLVTRKGRKNLNLEVVQTVDELSSVTGPKYSKARDLTSDEQASVFDEKRWYDVGLKIGAKAKLYRGISEDTGSKGAMYGLGLYTTTDKAQAKKYGAVTEMSHIDLPDNPLRFTTEMAFDNWVKTTALDVLGYRRISEFEAEHGDVGQFVKKYLPDVDGIQIGTGHGAFFAAWPEIYYSKDGTIQGAYDLQTGKTFLVADNVSPDGAFSMILHEVIHKIKSEQGWAGVFGNKSSGIMKSIEAKIKLNNPAWEAAEQKAIDAGTPSEDVREETIAYFMADNANQKQSLWRRIANAIRAWAVNLGITRTITDADIVSLAENAVMRAARKTAPVDSPDITPQMKEAVATEGMPLFARQPPTETEIAGSLIIERAIQNLKKQGQFEESKIRKAIGRYENKLAAARKIALDNTIDVNDKQRLVRDVLQELPMHVRGRALNEIVKVGTFRTDKGRQRAVERAMGRIAVLLDDYYRSEGIQEVDKLLQKARLRIKNGIAQGKSTPAHLKQVNRIRGIRGMSFDEIGTRLDEIIRDDQATEPTDEQVEEMALLNTFGALRDKTSEDVAAAIEELKFIIAEGQFHWQAILKKEKERRQELSSMAEEVIRGTEKPKTAADIEKEKLTKSKLMESFQEMSDKNQSWQWMMDKLSRFDKESDPLQSRLSKYFTRLVHGATHRENAGLATQEANIRQNAKDIFGKKGLALQRIFTKNSQVIEKSGINLYGENGEVIEENFPTSQNTAYKKWQEWHNPNLREDLKRQGVTQTTINQIEDFMTPEVKAWAEWQMNDFYTNYYDGINEVFRAMTFTDMPRSEQYVPIRREYYKGQDPEDLLENQTYHASIWKGSHKRRVKTNLDIAWEDGDSTLAQHIGQMEHFKAWALPVKDLRSVFSSPKVKKAIRHHHGRAADKVVNSFIEDFARGGIDNKKNIRWIDSIRGGFVKAVLGGNVVVFVKQLTSIPAYAMDIPVASFMKGFAEAVANPRKAARVLMQSDMMQARYDKGFERDIALAMQRTVPKKLAGTRRMSDVMMAMTKLGDKAAIVLGGYSIYKYHLNQGKTREEALEQFEIVTESAQQATGTKDLSEYQRGGSIQKLFTMFMTTPASYLRHWEGGIRNLATGRGSKTENIKRVVMTHVVLPVMFQLAASGGEWDEEKIKRAVALGPLNGLFIARDILGVAFDLLFLGRTYGYTAAPPLEAITKMMERIASKGFELNDITQLLAVARVAKGVTAAVTGETEHPIRRSMGYSESALDALGTSYSKYNKIYNNELREWKKDRTKPKPKLKLKAIKTQITAARKRNNKEQERRLKQKFVNLSKE